MEQRERRDLPVVTDTTDEKILDVCKAQIHKPFITVRIWLESFSVPERVKRAEVEKPKKRRVSGLVLSRISTLPEEEQEPAHAKIEREGMDRRKGSRFVTVIKKLAPSARRYVLKPETKVPIGAVEKVSELSEEEQEKDHPRVGWPFFEGRRGQRGLQELLELDKLRPDRPGFTIVTIGDLHDDYESLKSYFKSRETWWRDNRIRSQVRDFLRGFDFHKGVFFLSEDRVNTMMSSVEGVTGLYLQKPEWNEIREGRGTSEKISQLLYEISLQFGEIRMKSKEGFDLEMNLSIFWPEKHVEDWEESKVKVTSLKK